ncbi:MAG: ABC transporter permease [Planctomycetota bacterium]|nr:MAG: ABC transporter permease [Planctomycetota bacterium]
MFRLALAYLLRHFTQLLAVLGMAVGLTALLCLLSVMNGLIEADRTSVRGPLSDLLLIPPASSPPPHWADYRRLLAGVPEVAAAAPHLVAYAVLGYSGSERMMERTLSSDLNGVQVVGVDPDLELRVGGFRSSLEAAVEAPVADPDRPFGDQDPEAFGWRPPVLVSDQHVRHFLLRPGERIQLGALPPVLPGPDEPFTAVNGSFDVVGSYSSTDYKVGMDRLYLRREDLRRNLLGSNSAEFNEVLIDLRPGTEPERAKAAILAAFRSAGLEPPGGPAGGSLETWEERLAVYLAAIENERRVTGLVMFFVVVVAGFGLYATLSALVRAKVRDLGVLAALGFSPLRRGGLLLLTGGIGSALGSLAGYAAAGWLSQGDRLEKLLAGLGIEVFSPGIYVVTGLPTLWLPHLARFYALCAFLTGLLFTAVPALRAATLAPVEALRYE